MASSGVSLERDSTQLTSEPGPQATPVSGENIGLAPNGLQDHGGNPFTAHSGPYTRPLEVPGSGNAETQQDQRMPTSEHNSAHFALFCTKYNEKAQKYDEALIERLRGSADSLLIFAGLFAATVTAFIIESYKTLSPDSGDTALFYLALISQQLAAASQSAEQGNTTVQLSSPLPFVATRSSVKVNILWILSLIFSLISALAATLVQSWLTRYKRLANRSPQPEQQASDRSYYFRGITQFRLVALAEILPALLHISLFLFLSGLIVFLFPINKEVAHVITAVIVAFAALYLVLTIIPSLAGHAPYRTPFTAIYNPVLDVVLRCWIAVIAFCRSSAELLDITERVWRMLWNLEHICNTYRRSIGDNYPARAFDEERTAEARDWLISQLTTDDEREALMSTLVPIFTRPGKANSEWLKRFGSDHPPMPLHYLVLWHLPSILDSCLTPVQATIPRHSGDSNRRRRRHLQSCQAVLLQMVRTLQIELDILYPVLSSLRRLRNDQDPFIASHANIAITLILTRSLWYSAHKLDPPSVRIPSDWRLTDMLPWVTSYLSDDFVSRCPIILDMVAVSLLPLSSSTLDHRDHSRGTVDLGETGILTIGECTREEDTVIVPPSDYIRVFSLVALNELLNQLLDRDQLSNLAPPDPDSPLNIPLLARMVHATIFRVWFLAAAESLPSLSHDVEHALIHHTETIMDQLESASGSGQTTSVDGGSFGQPELPSLSSLLTAHAVHYLMLIVGDCLSDPNARSRGSELRDLFEQRRSIWFPPTSTRRS